MATFKGLIRPIERKQDGTWNVKIRVTHKRVTRYISTPLFVSQYQITRGFKIKDAGINDQLDAEIKKLRDAANKLGFIADSIDIDHLIQLITNDSSSIDFFEFMDDYIENIRKSGRQRTAHKYRTAYNSLYEYNKRRPLYFSSITGKYMYDFFAYINGKLHTNTVISYMSSIKVMYKAAQIKYNDDDTNIIIARHGVFNKIRLPAKDETSRMAFTVEQMQAIIDVPYSGTWIYDFTKDMFILSFVCFGINSIDLFYAKKSQYKDGILTYRRHKIARAKGKDSEMKIKMSEVGKIILKKYSGDKEYLIDFGKNVRRLEVCRYIHKTFQDAGLEEPNKLVRVGYAKGKYVFYTNRHTMATLARNECGIDYMTVHEMLNHTAPNVLKTTDVYVHRDYSKLWDANEKLLSLFDWSFYTKQKKN